MWSMDVCSKAWLSPWSAGSNLSPGEEGPSLRSAWGRSRRLPHAMESISHRSTTPMDQWRTDVIARRNGREDEQLAGRRESDAQGEGRRMGRGDGQRHDQPFGRLLPADRLLAAE